MVFYGISIEPSPHSLYSVLFLLKPLVLEKRKRRGNITAFSLYFSLLLSFRLLATCVLHLIITF